MNEDNRDNSILRFLATRWYILLVLSLLVLTVLGHFRVVSIELNMLIHLFIVIPYGFLKKYQCDDAPKNKKNDIINMIIEIALIVIVVIGLVAEFIWPYNKWILIIRLLTLVGIVAWSLYAKGKV